MKNVKTILLFFISLFLVSTISFFSCSNISDDSNSNSIYRIGKITKISGEIAESASRILLPDFQGCFFKIYAKNADTAISDINGTINTSTSPISFSFELPDGRWSLIVEAYADEAFSNLMLSGMYIDSQGNDFIELNENSNATKLSPIILSPAIPSGSSSGTFKIEIEADSDVDLQQIGITSEPSGIFFAPSTTTFSANPLTILKNDITAGVYKVNFSFFDSTSKCFFSFSDLVYIYPDKTTNTWNTKYPFIKENKIHISKELIESLNNEIFYVDESVTSGTGSYFSPLSSLSEAIDKIKTKNNGTTEYKIILLREINEENFDITTLNPNIPLKIGIGSLDNSPKKIKLGLGKGFTVGTNAQLALENITIENGSDTEAAGIDLYGTLILDGNITITGNKIAGTAKESNVFIRNTGIIKVGSTLSGEVGISSPTLVNSQIITSNYNKDTITVFKSDNPDYVLALTKLASSNEIVIMPKPAEQSGEIGMGSFDTISFSLSNTSLVTEAELYNQVDQTLTFYALLDGTVAPNSKITDWDIRVFDGTADLTASGYFVVSGNTLTIKKGIPEETTFNVSVSALYEKETTKIPYQNTIFVKMTNIP